MEPQKMTGFPILEDLGLELLSSERGRCEMRLPFENNGNHVGILYAGALFTLGEVPGGVLFSGAFDSKRFYPIVVEMSIKFLKPGTTAATVVADMSDDEIDRVTAELEEKGRSRYVLTTEIRDESGTVIATTEGSYAGFSF